MNYLKRLNLPFKNTSPSVINISPRSLDKHASIAEFTPIDGATVWCVQPIMARSEQTYPAPLHTSQYSGWNNWHLEWVDMMGKAEQEQTNTI